MAECKEATPSWKSAHHKKKAIDHHPNTLASHIWKRTENFQIFGTIREFPNIRNYQLQPQVGHFQKGLARFTSQAVRYPQ